ncbi:unnamed protein product [Amoebophrya sp. A120]|nr:unnamed protein product [Amoebophrya sp. A120]|eukprot:GSA120T00003703001.1
MPPQKKDKKKGMSRAKQVSSFEAVKARNRGEDPYAPKDAEKDAGESSSSDEEEGEDDPKVFKKEKGATLADLMDRQTLNGALNNEDEAFADGPSRKQREEIEKEKKRRAYEKLHREGKTDEAKADLARLAEIKKRREAAAKEREEKLKAEEAKKAPERGGNSAYVDALGGEKSRKLPGSRKKDECGDMLSAYHTTKKVEEVDPATALAGSIEACRLEEDDFM